MKKATKVTNQQLADFYGVHKNTISNWEKTEGRRRLARAARLYYHLEQEGLSKGHLDVKEKIKELRTTVC